MKLLGIFIKDWQSELRTRYAINALAMFILVTISVILFSIGNENPDEFLIGGMFWVVIFFSAMSGLSRSFVSEEERGTSATLMLIAKASTVFGGKLLFNIVLVFLMNFVIPILFAMLFETFVVRNLPLFTFSIILGNIGIAVSSTLIASIISKANTKGTLYPVLSFPILLPLILILIELTKYSIEGVSIGESWVEFAILIIYDIVMTISSFLLFDFIWKD